MAAYRRVYDSHHLQADCQEPGSDPELHTRQSSMGYPFSTRTTWISQYQKGKTSLDLNEARDDGVVGWQWHQLDHMQSVCTLIQTDNHTNTSSLNFFTGRMLFQCPTNNVKSLKAPRTPAIK